MTMNESTYDGQSPVGDRLNSPNNRDDLVVSNVPQLIYHCLDSGSCVWTNSQWTHFTGMETEKSLGFGWLDAMHPEDRTESLGNWKVARAREMFTAQQRIWCVARKEYRWHLASARRVAGLDEWIGAFTDVHDLVVTQKQQDVLIAELQHRARNLLTVAWSIANKTARKSASLDSFRVEFRKRIGALSRVQKLKWHGRLEHVDLRQLLMAELDAHSPEGIASGRITMDGPAIALSASAAQCMGLAVHELATNALKYGALSVPHGQLNLTWEVDASGEPAVRFTWRERGVHIPSASRKQRRSGYGTELIMHALPFDLGAKTNLSFEPDGVLCTIEIDRERFRSSDLGVVTTGKATTGDPE